MFIKNLIAVGILLLVFQSASGFDLVKDSKPNAQFYVKQEDCGRDAIAYFNQEMKKCGIPPFTVTDSRSQNGNTVILECREVSPLKAGFFTIDFPAKNAMRITGTVQSIRFAFNHILDAYAGRMVYFGTNPWYEPKLIDDYPQIKDLHIPEKTFTDGPSMPVRFSVSRSAAQWNSASIYWGTHFLTMYAFPAAKYAKESTWPEGILPVYGGQKYHPAKLGKEVDDALKGRNTILARSMLTNKYYKGLFNPCWSAKETEDVAVANLLEAIQADPNLKCITIDISDCTQCECARCIKAVEKSNSVGNPSYSELYWRWVNNVAHRINAKYPNILFCTLAYREVMDPPSFKLSPNVIVGMCFELCQMMDPKVASIRRKLMNRWKDKCSLFSFYGYGHGGLDSYFLPRLYCHLNGSVLKEFHEQYQLRGYHHENYNNNAINGPEYWIVSQKLWNKDADVDALLAKWYNGVCGPKAEPYVREYFTFWENYWKGNEIKKTQWYQSIYNIYQTLGDYSHILALQNGDMARCRKLMEQIVANAETPAQKNRAKILMQGFECAELAAKAMFAEIIPPDGSIADAKTAAAILKSLPEAAAALQKFSQHPFVMRNRFPIQIETLQTILFSRILPYSNDPQVKQLLLQADKTQSLTKTMASFIKFINAGDKIPNRLENSSYEDPAPLPVAHAGKPVRSADVAHSGNYALMINNGRFYFGTQAKPGESYLFIVWLYTNKPSAEGKISVRMGPAFTHPRTGAHFTSWFNVDDVKLPAKQWTPIVVVGKVSETAQRNGGLSNSVYVYLYFNNFEKDEFIWIDDVKLTCLEDLK